MVCMKQDWRCLCECHQRQTVGDKENGWKGVRKTQSKRNKTSDWTYRREENKESSREKYCKSDCPYRCPQSEWARSGGTTTPRSLCGAAGQDVNLLGNAYKQYGCQRERSLERESALSPAGLGRPSRCNPGNTVARSKASSATMASFSHGTEIKREFQKRLLLPPPTAHPPLSSRGAGPSLRRGILLGRVRGVRNAEFGGVPSPTPICILTPAPGFLQLPNLAASVAFRFCTYALGSPHSFWPGTPFPDGEGLSLLLISVLFLVFFTSSLGWGGVGAQGFERIETL